MLPCNDQTSHLFKPYSKPGQKLTLKAWMAHGQYNDAPLCLVVQEERLGCRCSDGGARSISRRHGVSLLHPFRVMPFADGF
jgi:hypothetical protein